MSTIETINKEISLEIAKPEVQKALLLTTFKGLNLKTMQQAMVEGMMRGFKFKDFLEKNVYAIPFKDGYSLITSIDYARKVGMRSGVVGTSKPEYQMDGTKIESCTVTVKKKLGEYVGEYSATVYFEEYYKAGRNGYPSLWDSKPRTMIAKVAEMHALRKACPEELAQTYTEEEIQKTVPVEIKIDDFEQKLKETKSLEELGNVWSSIPQKAKKELKDLKDELKKQYESPEVR